ncbi:MAG TPA: SPOR domain-containing protein, partial [Rhodothermales bacterium]
ESSSTEQVNVSASVAAPAPTRASGPQEQIAESDEPSLAPAAASESSLAALPTEIPAYSWVVASMTDASEAASLSWRHRTAGRPSAVIATHIDGQARYRVTLGAFESLDAARAARDDLGDWLPEDAWVLERDKGGIATD